MGFTARARILVSGGIAASAIAVATALSLGGGPGAGPANLWVDTNGGSCTRQASPAVYSDAAACGSLDAAYDASSCGDTVYIKPGTYGNQNISGNRTCASNTVFQGEPGQPEPLFGAIDSPYGNPGAGPDWITFRGFGFVDVPDNQYYTDTQQGFGFYEGFTNVLVDDVDFGSWYIEKTSNITIRNSDVGPCEAFSGPNTVQQCSNNRITRSSNVLIEGNNIHDYRFGQSCFPIGPNDCHWESMFLANQLTNVTVRGNRFSGCGDSGCIYGTIFNDGTVPTFGHNGLTIENNWFEQAQDDTSFMSTTRKDVAVSLGHCEGTGGVDYNNVKIRFNSFGGNSTLNNAGTEESCSVGAGGYQVVGNIFGSLGAGACASYITWDRNIWAGAAGCGANQTLNHPLANIYVSDSNNASKDHHLKGAAGSTVADNLVPTSVAGGCPATDYDGASRPGGASCDAGADER